MSTRRLTLDVRDRGQRLYDRLRTRIVPRHLGASTGVRDLILLIPDFAVLLARLARDPQVPTGLKWVAGCTLAYVASPIDLLPEILLGPIGAIDDLIAISWGVSFLVNRLHPDLIRQHWPGAEDAIDAIERVSEWTERQVTKRLLGALSRIPGLGR